MIDFITKEYLANEATICANGAIGEPWKKAFYAHEFAHYHIAAPERKHLPDFGLGTNKVKPLISTQETHNEDVRASLLGVLWQIQQGQPATDWGIIALKFFICEDKTLIVKTFNWLVDNKFINSSGKVLINFIDSSYTPTSMQELVKYDRV